MKKVFKVVVSDTINLVIAKNKKKARKEVRKGNIYPSSKKKDFKVSRLKSSEPLVVFKGEDRVFPIVERPTTIPLPVEMGS